MPITVREFNSGKLYWWRRFQFWFKYTRIRKYLRIIRFRTRNIPMTRDEWEHWRSDTNRVLDRIGDANAIKDDPISR
jgi:hypothetical protein